MASMKFYQVIELLRNGEEMAWCQGFDKAEALQKFQRVLGINDGYTRTLEIREFELRPDEYDLEDTLGLSNAICNCKGYRVLNRVVTMTISGV